MCIFFKIVIHARVDFSKLFGFVNLQPTDQWTWVLSWPLAQVWPFFLELFRHFSGFAYIPTNSMNNCNNKTQKKKTDKHENNVIFNVKWNPNNFASGLGGLFHSMWDLSDNGGLTWIVSHHWIVPIDSVHNNRIELTRFGMRKLCHGSNGSIRHINLIHGRISHEIWKLHLDLRNTKIIKKHWLN